MSAAAEGLLGVLLAKGPIRILKSQSGLWPGRIRRVHVGVPCWYETLKREGEGALLRQEGWYSSLVSERREQRDKGALD